MPRLTQQRAAQGLPPTVENADVLAQIAAIVLGDGEGAAEATPSELASATALTRSSHEQRTPAP